MAKPGATRRRRNDRHIMALILGLESSCDETAAAVVEDGVAVRANIVWSQHELHERYAGVVPEIASRAHLQRLTPVVEQTLTQAGVTWERIDAIAVGNRPGLIGSLIVGVSAAKALAWSLGKPLIGIDHVRAHLWAAALVEVESGEWGVESGEWKVESRESRDGSPARTTPHPPLSTPHSPLSTPHSPLPTPALGLVVSGGHTSLYAMHSPTDLTRLGATIDDAVGEAFDKAANILDAGYPGGPAIDRLAQQGNATNVEPLPRSMLGPDSLDFSFSGLKTALLYRVRGKPIGRGKHATFERRAADLSDAQRADLAAAFQTAAVEAVIAKLERALDHMQRDGEPATRLIIGGGVSANSLLRQRVTELGEARGLPVHIPALRFCVDNAAMIAGLAYHPWTRGEHDSLDLPAIATTSL